MRRIAIPTAHGNQSRRHMAPAREEQELVDYDASREPVSPRIKFGASRYSLWLGVVSIAHRMMQWTWPIWKTELPTASQPTFL